jgi:hypothetical protein
MSSQLVFAGAAFGRHFVFAPPQSDVLREPEVHPNVRPSPDAIAGQRKLPAFAYGESALGLFPAVEFPAVEFPARSFPALNSSAPALPEPAFPEPFFPEPDFSDTEFPGPDLPEPDLPPSVQRLPALPKLGSVTPASQLDVRPAPMMVPSGIAQMDSLTGGLPRGCLSEICGPASSGRTSLMLSAIAAATRRQEACVLIDASDALDPKSLVATGVQLHQLLWVRCGGATEAAQKPREDAFAEKRFRDRPEYAALENVLRVTDLLLQSSGFGLVAIDLGDIAPRVARRIPLTTWFRFRRAVEHTDTVLLVIGQQSCAQTCASLVLRFAGKKRCATRPLSSNSQSAKKMKPEQPIPSHAQILGGLQVQVELMRSRLERKPSASVSAFETNTAWAGRS